MTQLNNSKKDKEDAVAKAILDRDAQNETKNKEKDKKLTDLMTQLNNSKKDKEDAVAKALEDQDKAHKFSLDLKDQEYKKKLDQIRKKQEAAIVGTGYIASELAGEGLEETIKEYLMKWYPNFDIKDIVKGKRGGDHIITVKLNSTQVGKIKIEAKNTQSWSDDYIKKLKEDMLLHKASYGLIIAKTPHDSFKSPYTILNDDNITICDLSNPNSIKCAIDSYIGQLQIEGQSLAVQNNNHKISEGLIAWRKDPSTKMRVQSLFQSFADREVKLTKRETAFKNEIKKERTALIKDRDTFLDLFIPLQEVDKLEDINFLGIDYEEE